MPSVLDRPRDRAGGAARPGPGLSTRTKPKHDVAGGCATSEVRSGLAVPLHDVPDRERREQNHDRDRDDDEEHGYRGSRRSGLQTGPTVGPALGRHGDRPAGGRRPGRSPRRMSGRMRRTCSTRSPERRRVARDRRTATAVDVGQLGDSSGLDGFPGARPAPSPTSQLARRSAR